MATARGRSEVSSYLALIPEQLAQRVLRGAARAAGQVVAEEAKVRADAPEVAAAIQVRTKVEGHRVVVRVTVKEGWAYSLALWQEYGTSPHFIRVDDRQRDGQGVGRINAKVREADGDGSLVIGGKFVGATVFHPGARPNPFLRTSLDLRQPEAIRAAQTYINAHVTPAGILGADDGDET